jgi:rhodanese-related sulfurtransferase
VASFALATPATVAPARVARATKANAAQRSAVRALKATRTRSVAMRSSKQVVRAATMEEQQKQMAAAEKRWQANVTSGRVRSVSASELQEMTDSGEWTVLDVRPIEEVEKAFQAGSVHVPLFEVDDDMSVTGLLKQMSAFGMGGWWLGGQHMKPNDQFMGQVMNKVPTDAKVVITCQKGLRSLAACEQLSKAGYGEIAWLNGGYEAVEKGAIKGIGENDIRMAGVGGLSGMIGANPLQAKEKSILEGPLGTVIKVTGALIVLDGLAFLYEFANAAK